jgi:Carboxypeptidase regulatory-like domain
MSKAVAKTVAFAIFSLLGARCGLACSCAGPIPVCSVYWTTDVLFLGHVVQVEHVYNEPPEEKIVGGKKMTLIGPGQNLVHFAVTKSYRGTPGAQLIVHTNDQGSACGYAFEQGRDYLVYAFSGSNGELSTSHCTRTHEVSSPEADPDIQWIEALPKSPPGASVFGSIRTLRVNEDGGYDAAGLAHVTVSIRGPESKTVTSDADGRFRADGLAPGKYVVSAKPPSQYAPFGDTTVTLQDHSCAEIPWSTRLDGHIRGHVYFSDGTPAEGVYLTAKAARALPHEPWTWMASYFTTGADGAFDFAQLAPGSYVFGVNVDFTSQDGKPYYRKAFFPGSPNRAEAGIVAVGPGETVDKLSFFLPPDSLPATVPLRVTVLGFDGKPVSHAEILAEDDIWENSVTPLTATADESGQATITLRPGSHYDVGAYVNLPDFSQACAEPQGVDPNEQPATLVLKLSQHIGNCWQLKKTQAK